MNDFLGTQDVKHCATLLRRLFAEFLGTLLYLSIVLLSGTNIGSNNVATALANGLLVAAIVQIIGQISGGHINPAVTLGVLVDGGIKLLPAIFYVVSQAAGSIAGSGISYLISLKESRGVLGATIPFEDLSVLQVLVLEFLMTFLLVSVVLSAVRSNWGVKGSAPLAIGLSVTACQCACVAYSGSLNPVRSLGPAVIMNIWTHHWVYWAGPLLGGLLAGLVRRFIFD